MSKTLCCGIAFWSSLLVRVHWALKPVPSPTETLGYYIIRRQCQRIILKHVGIADATLFCYCPLMSSLGVLQWKCTSVSSQGLNWPHAPKCYFQLWQYLTKKWEYWLRCAVFWLDVADLVVKHRPAWWFMWSLLDALINTEFNAFWVMMLVFRLCVTCYTKVIIVIMNMMC